MKQEALFCFTLTNTFSSNIYLRCQIKILGHINLLHKVIYVKVKIWIELWTKEKNINLYTIALDNQTLLSDSYFT
jgi:hypothetical protein